MMGLGTGDENDSLKHNCVLHIHAARKSSAVSIQHPSEWKTPSKVDKTEKRLRPDLRFPNSTVLSKFYCVLLSCLTHICNRMSLFCIVGLLQKLRLCLMCLLKIPLKDSSWSLFPPTLSAGITKCPRNDSFLFFSSGPGAFSFLQYEFFVFSLQSPEEYALSSALLCSYIASHPGVNFSSDGKRNFLIEVWPENQSLLGRGFVLYMILKI